MLLCSMVRIKQKPSPNSYRTIAYNAFTKYGGTKSWCGAHALNFRTMSRAVSIRGQLKKYMQRFGLPLDSCQGDAKRLRQCLVSGYWRNGARYMPDGTYRSVRGNKVLAVHPTSVLFTRKPRSGWVIFHEMEETKKTQCVFPYLPWHSSFDIRLESAFSQRSNQTGCWITGMCTRTSKVGRVSVVQSLVRIHV